MVAIEQNMLYVIIAVVVILIILTVVFVRRRGSKNGPSNVNEYLTKEAEHKKLEIAEKDTGFKMRIPLFMRRPEDDLEDIREVTSQLEHRNAYLNSKVEFRLEKLESDKKDINIQRKLKDIEKRDLKLNSPNED